MSTFTDSLLQAEATKQAFAGFGQQNQVNSYSYSDIKDLQDFYEETDPTGALSGLDTGVFSSLLQASDPRGDFSLGLNSGLIKDASNQVNRGFRAAGINALGSSVAGTVGKGFDALTGNEEGKGEEFGREIGEGLGRTVAQGVGFVGGLAAAPFTGGASLVVSGASVADAFGQGFTATDSVGQGLTAATLTAVAPGVGKIGANVGLKTLGKVAGTKALTQTGFKAAAKRVAVTELGQEAAFFASDAVTQGLAGENPFSYDNLLANVIGNVALAPVSIKGMLGSGGAVKPTVGLFDGVKSSYGITKKETVVAEIPEARLPEEVSKVTSSDHSHLANLIAEVNPVRRDLYNELVGKADDFAKTHIKDDVNRAQFLNEAESAFGLKTPTDQTVLLSKTIESAEDVMTLNKLYNEAVAQSEVKQAALVEDTIPIKRALADLKKLEDTEEAHIAKFEAANAREINRRDRSLSQSRTRRIEETKNKIAKLREQARGQQSELDSVNRGIAEERVNQDQLNSAVSGSVAEQNPNRAKGLGSEAFKDKSISGRRTPKSVGKAVGGKARGGRNGQTRFKLIGAEEIYGMVDKNIDRGDTPAQAAMRVGQQLQGMAKDVLKNGNDLPKDLVAQTVSVLGRTFDYMGVNQKVKGPYMDAALNVLEKLPLDPRVKIGGLDELNSGIRPSHAERHILGLYSNDKDFQIGINTKQGNSTPGLDALQATTTLLHESMHSVFHKLDNDLDLGTENSRITALRDARDYAHTATVEERRGILSSLYDGLIPAETRRLDKLRDGSVENWKDYGSSSGEEFLTEVATLFALSGQGNPKKGRGQSLVDNFRFLPSPVKDFLRAVFKTANELKDMVKATLPKSEHARFDQFGKDIDTILKPDPVEVEAKQALADVTKPLQLDQTNSGLVGVQFKKTGIGMLDNFLKQDKEYKGTNSFFLKFGSLQQLLNTPKYEQNFPSGKQVIDVLTRSGGEIKTKMNTMLADEMVRLDGGKLAQLSSQADGKLTKDQLFKKNARVRYQDHLPLRVGLSDAMRQLNDDVNNGNLAAGWADASIQDHVKGLSPEDQAVAKLFFETRLEGSRQASGLIKLGFSEETTLLTAQIFQKAGLDNDTSERLGRMAVNSMLQDLPLPAEISSRPEASLVSQFIESQRAITKDAFSSLDKPFFSEMRSGKFNLRVDRRDGEKPILIPADSAKEVKAWETKIKDKGWVLVSNTKSADMQFNEFDVVPSAVLQKMIGMSESRAKAYEQLTGSSVSEDFRLGANSVLSGLREELNDRKSFLAERKFANGRENLDMLSSQDGYFGAVAASVTKRVNRARVSFLMSSPEWQKDPKLAQELKGFSNELLNKKQVRFTTFNKMVSVSKMGLNISSAVVDSSQSITMGIPSLAADTSIGNAVKYIRQGYKEAFLPSKDQDPEFAEILTKAHNQQHLITGAAFEEAFNTADVDAFNVSRAADHKTLIDTKGAFTNPEFMWYKTIELTKKWGQHLGDKAMTPTKISSQINNKTMLFAAFKVGKEKGLSGDALYNFALSKMQSVNIQGGRAASSSIKLTGNANLNAVIESGTLLTKYPVAYMSSMVGNFQSALKTSGLDAATRKKSGRIFATQMGISMAFSGAVGGLGIGTISAVMKQITGYNIEEDMQESLAELTNPRIADILLNGVMNQTGIDFASRFKIGGVAGVSDFNGFESKDIFHAGGSFIESLLLAPEQIHRGDFSKIDIIPPSLRKLYSATVDEGKVFNKGGELVMDLDGADNLQYALGFRPTKLTAKQKQLSMLRDMEGRNRDRTQGQKQKYADDVLAGNFEKVKPVIEENIQLELDQFIQQGINGQELQKLKDRLFKAEAKKFITAATDRIYETDIFDSGSGATAQQRARLQNTFGRHRTPRAMKAERAQKEMEILSQLTGKPIDRRSKTMRMLRMIDRVILEDPSLTRGQARIIAQEKLSGSARYGSTLEQDFR